jgi:hypothetical protein
VQDDNGPAKHLEVGTLKRCDDRKNAKHGRDSLPNGNARWSRFGATAQKKTPAVLILLEISVLVLFVSFIPFFNCWNFLLIFGNYLKFFKNWQRCTAEFFTLNSQFTQFRH